MVTRKKKPAKKRATKRPAKSPSNGSAVLEPVEVEIEGETRFRLEALQLRLDAKRKEISDMLVTEHQAKFNQALERTLRNDQAFSKLNDEFQKLLNETASDLSPGEGYVAQNLNTSDGVLRYVATG